MHHTKIKVFKIAQTRINWVEISCWLGTLGVKNPEAIARQLSTGTDASKLIALAGKRCYNSFEVGTGNPNVQKIREDHAEYITNILKSGHGSVLEHASWTFAIENISRVFTGEMNRHRAGTAISEASMRYIRFDDIGFTMPASVETTPGLPTNDHETEKLETQKILNEAFTQQQRMYLDLCNVWKIEQMKDFTTKKKLTSLFRRIIGMGVSTGGVWSMNARALRFILEKRASVHAEEEIFAVFDHIADLMIADQPLLFGDFTKDSEGSWVPKYSKI